jgi:hypothetical protein
MRLVVTAVLSLTFALAQQAEGGARELNRVVVRTHAGKIFNGTFDRRSSDTQLYLRFGGGSTTIVRRIAWSDVATVTHHGAPIEKLALLAMATEDDVSSEGAAQEREGQPRTSTFRATASDAWMRDEAAQRWFDYAPRVTHLQFDAVVANWNQDAETDGLLLHIRPLDQKCQLVPVRGTIDVRLMADRHTPFHQVPQGCGEVPRTVGRWTVPVERHDFGAAGAVVELPFSNRLPDHDPSWAEQGTVHVRLAAPGHGVFDEKVTRVRVRRQN